MGDYLSYLHPLLLFAMSCQIPLAMRLTFKYRINSERVELKMERADQTEILSEKSLPFGGVPYFLFQAAQTEITVPFGQRFHFYLICYLFAPSSAISWVF